VGAVVGSVVGAVVGSVVGAVVGSVVGAVVGSVVGAVVGSVVGAVVGSVVGAVVGSVVGTVVFSVLWVPVSLVGAVVLSVLVVSVVLCAKTEPTGIKLSSITIDSKKLIIRFFTGMYSFQIRCPFIITDHARYCNPFFSIITHLLPFLTAKCYHLFIISGVFSIFLQNKFRQIVNIINFCSL